MASVLALNSYKINDLGQVFLLNPSKVEEIEKSIWSYYLPLPIEFTYNPERNELVIDNNLRKNCPSLDYLLSPIKFFAKDMESLALQKSTYVNFGYLKEIWLDIAKDKAINLSEIYIENENNAYLRIDPYLLFSIGILNLKTKLLRKKINSLEKLKNFYLEEFKNIIKENIIYYYSLISIGYIELRFDKSKINGNVLIFIPTSMI